MMKIITTLAFLLAFIFPYGIASADTTDDVTMHVLEDVDSAEITHEIQLPDETGDRAEVNHHVDLPEHANDEAEENVNENHENLNDNKPEIEAPEIEAPEAPEAS